MRTRTLELNEVNAFLETILGSMGAAVAVLDGRQAVQIWNGNAEDLWGVRADEAVGQHFLALDIGLPVEHLRSAVREALQGVDGHGTMVLEATNRRGRQISCAVTTLLHERLSISSGVGMGGQKDSPVAFETLRHSVDTTDPVVKDQLVELYIRGIHRRADSPWTCCHARRSPRAFARRGR